jgi:NitT/TauT family transport system substrate-binding protein
MFAKTSVKENTKCSSRNHPHQILGPLPHLLNKTRKSMRNRINILIGIILAATLLLSGCSGSDPGKADSSGGTKLTVGLTYQPDIQFAPFYVAKAQGWFAAAGLNVELRHHGTSETLFGALNNGTEQVVFAGGDEALQARSQGNDVVGIATVYRQYPVVLIVPDSSDIHSAADLKGKKIGIPGPFGENYFGLLVLLQQAGLTQSDVKVMNIGYTQQAALTSGDVDAVIGFSNNDVIRFGEAGFAVRTIPLAQSGEPDLVGAGLATSQKVLDTRKADLQTMIGVLRRAMQFCIDDPEKTVELSAQFVPTLSDPDQKADALATLKATTPLFGSAADFAKIDPQQWSAMATFMDQAGLLGGSVDPTTAVDTSVAS